MVFLFKRTVLLAFGIRDIIVVSIFTRIFRGPMIVIYCIWCNFYLQQDFIAYYYNIIIILVDVSQILQWAYG